jgi:uncharacterized membrane protein
VAEPSDVLLDLPVTRGRLHALAGAGILDQAELAHALSESGHRPTRASWSAYLYWHALIVGVVLLVAGVIFFVAANWSVLPGFVRMGLIGGPMVAAFSIGGYLGESLPGRVASLLGGLLFGPLLAVYGQVYQTGADAWELFAIWTAVLVATGALVRFVGTWVLALFSMHLACCLWIDQELGGPLYEGIGATVIAGLALVDALIVVLAERFTKASEREVITHVAAFFGLALVLPFGVLAMFDESSYEWFGLAVLVFGLFAIWWVYRWRRPALGMLAAFATVVTILVSTVLAKLLFDVLEADELLGLAVLGAAICGQVWGFTRWLLAWRREHAGAAGGAR